MSSSLKIKNKKNFVLNHLNKNLNQFYNYLSQKFIVLKKGFTLVELSIVLLVLALLVSTLLVGRQIIDRAKVQQIVSELDYYTKNFQMFRDQYDFLPGALDEGNCRKYPEFSMQKGTDTTQFPSQCDDPDAMIAQGTNKYYTSYKQANKSMLDMVHSGMVENRSTGERRRKIYDIADAMETVCVQRSALYDGFYKFTNCNSNVAIGEFDATKFMYILWTCNKDKYRIEICGKAHVLTPQNTTNDVMVRQCGNKAFYSSNLSIEPYRGKSGQFGGIYRKNCSSATETFNGTGCDEGEQLDISTNTLMPLSTYGLSIHKGEMIEECETKTIEGEKRRSYLLNKDEIQDNANRSTTGDKVWITYSSGNVDMNMTYGIGGQDNQIGVKNSNAIVYFLFDESKSEIYADGAVSYSLYDLLNKKINGLASDKTTGMLTPISKTSGEGFNFAYAMRD